MAGSLYTCTGSDVLSAGTASAIALGNFDGLHRGHQKVLGACLKKAEEMQLVPVVVLFDEHPRKVLEGYCPEKLMTDEYRDKKLREKGFYIIRCDFSAVKDMSPDEFIMALYVRLNARAVCCGFNYRYGKGGAGTAETLRRSCERLGLALDVSEHVDYQDEPVSSSRIRQCLSEGRIEDANAMLGYTFSYESEVVLGQQRGRILGFPTANQFFLPDQAVPKKGVYVSTLRLGDRWYTGVTNIGTSPTAGGEKLHSETHILDFYGDLYGRKIRIFLHSFLREEKTFDNFDLLRQVISRDVEAAQEVKIDEDDE